MTVLDSGNPLVEMAELILDEVTSAIQSEGWIFNTEYCYPFLPNAQGEIVIPRGCYWPSMTKPTADDCFLVQRRGKLYDKASHSYQFDGKQELDVVWLVDFTDMPDIP